MRTHTIVTAAIVTLAATVTGSTGSQAYIFKGINRGSAVMLNPQPLPPGPPPCKCDRFSSFKSLGQLSSRRLVTR
jgi:hypothetical protein